MARLRKADSTSIGKFAYSEKTGSLFIEFSNGGAYKYDAVPAQIFSGLRDAPSMGKYFRANILNVFAYQRITDFQEFVALTGDRSLVAVVPVLMDEIEGEEICLL